MPGHWIHIDGHETWISAYSDPTVISSILDVTRQVDILYFDDSITILFSRMSKKASKACVIAAIACHYHILAMASLRSWLPE